MSSSYRNSLNQWLSNLEVKAFSVGDVGGAQEKVKDRVKSWDVGLYTIYDLENPHSDSPKPDKILDLNVATVYPLSTHDLIFCLEVADYIYDPKHAMEVLSLMLTKGGILWMSFPTFYPTHNPIEDDALCYKEGGIRKLAEASGLKVIQMIRRRPETDAIDQLWRRERMRAAKNYDHDFTGWIVEFQK